MICLRQIVHQSTGLPQNWRMKQTYFQKRQFDVMLYCFNSVYTIYIEWYILYKLYIIYVL